MGLWPYFWLSYEGLESWQGFEATLGFNFLFLHFSIFLYFFSARNVVVVLPGTWWAKREPVKCNHDRGLTLVRLKEGHTVTPAAGLPLKEERNAFGCRRVISR